MIDNELARKKRATFVDAMSTKTSDAGIEELAILLLIELFFFFFFFLLLLLSFLSHLEIALTS